jgi:hypothetical protein
MMKYHEILRDHEASRKCLYSRCAYLCAKFSIGYHVTRKNRTILSCYSQIKTKNT